MIWLARVGLRLASLVGLRWMVVAALGRFVVRRLSRSAVERAAADLEARARDRLPAPAARAVAALPPPVLHAGGSAVVATRAARSALAGGRRAHRVTRRGRDRVGAGVGAARGGWARIQGETDATARSLRSRLIRATLGPTAATDALLDRHRVGSGADEVDLVDAADPAPVKAVDVVDRHPGGTDDPHDRVASPVTPGRRRARPALPSRPDRASRRYQVPPKPWDRRRSPG